MEAKGLSEQEAKLMREARMEIHEIIEALARCGSKIPEPRLKEAYEEFHGRKAPKDMDPSARGTWDLLIGFGANGRHFLPRGEEPSWRRPKLRLDHLSRMRKVLQNLQMFSGGPEPTADMSSWGPFLGSDAISMMFATV